MSQDVADTGIGVAAAALFGCGVTLFGLLFTPIFYVVVRNLADGGKPKREVAV